MKDWQSNGRLAIRRTGVVEWFQLTLAISTFIVLVIGCIGWGYRWWQINRDRRRNRS